MSADRTPATAGGSAREPAAATDDGRSPGEQPPPPTPDSVHWDDAQRQHDFSRWLAAQAPTLGLQPDSLRLASADASFRRYLRIDADGRTLVVMDAPPPREDTRPFVHVAALLRDAGLHVPQILAADTRHGFLLLEDLGTRPYLAALRAAAEPERQRWMREAVDALVLMQQAADASTLPRYDEALLAAELELFPQWCVQREFGIHWTPQQREQWDTVCRTLVDSALAQPRVLVHRDWMPRNLMLADPNPGVLDFQDAVCGPITYDIASLLRDAFVSWDEATEIDWAVRWWQAARGRGLPVAEDFGECWRQIEWMGMQRHLKVAGIFCRLKHRDGKPAYAADLPRFFDYLTKVALRYTPLKRLLPLLEPLSGRAVASGFTF
jgi:aminoglycoside/choline kinase family phosphotransferase